MSERSVQCPDCRFSFARLVDAGRFRAYVCSDCGWTRATTDARPGNRPADVCALCDTPIDLTHPTDHHLYIGPGWIHGGGRESIPVHITCINAGEPRDTLRREMARAWVGQRLGADVDPIAVHEAQMARRLESAS